MSEKKQINETQNNEISDRKKIKIKTQKKQLGMTQSYEKKRKKKKE